jgi:hypothetical protein
MNGQSTRSGIRIKFKFAIDRTGSGPPARRGLVVNSKEFYTRLDERARRFLIRSALMGPVNEEKTASTPRSSGGEERPRSKPLIATLRVTNLVRKGQASHRKSVLHGGWATAPARRSRPFYPKMRGRSLMLFNPEHCTEPTHEPLRP